LMIKAGPDRLASLIGGLCSRDLYCPLFGSTLLSTRCSSSLTSTGGYKQ
uniref:DUF1893 domain-containing protein n=1 Tax=Schistocephalus solidus TaxID=70667 RepID=A0A183TTW4_SCHSO